MDTKTLYSKLVVVPKPIMVHLGLESTIDLVDRLEDKFHLPRGSSATISKLIQRLQVKEINPEYFAGEISLELKLEKNQALLISEEVKKSIFGPIKDKLTEYGVNIDLLDKFQIPPTKTIQPPVPSGPQIISENFAPTPNAVTSAKPVSAQSAPAPAKAPIPTQAVTSQTAAGMSLGATPLASNKNTPGVAPQPAKQTNNQGWSRQASQDPVVKLGVITPSVPTPAQPTQPTAAPATGAIKRDFVPAKPVQPAATPPPAQPTKTVPGAKVLSEFERLDIQKKGGTQQAQQNPQVPTQPAAPTPTSAPAVSAQKPPEPAPIMLHEIGTPVANQKMQSFEVNTGIKNQFTNVPIPKAPPPPRAAVIEFGMPAVKPAAPQSQPPKPAMAQQAPVGNTPSRPAPVLVQPPKPPTPPAPPAKKVIVQDFLGPQK